MNSSEWISSCEEQQAAFARRVKELTSTKQLRPFIEETEDWLVGCEEQVTVNTAGVDLEYWRMERMNGPEALSDSDRDQLRELIERVTFGLRAGSTSEVR